MRPVDDKYPISQLFAGLATQGIIGRPNGSEVEYLVWLYGNYQPYGHAGVDIACPVGTPIRAMRSGTVVYCGWGEDLPGNDSWGPSGYFRRWGMYKNFPGIVTVIKADGTDEFDIYGHQSSNDEVSVGMHVNEGQIIGKSGDTKTRSEKVGPHLHVVTVADPVNYSTDWPRLIFGCVDPTPLFGSTGIILQGALTNAATQFQEDDMPYTPEEIKQFVHEGTLRALKEEIDAKGGGKTSVLGVTSVMDDRFNKLPDRVWNDVQIQRRGDAYGDNGGMTTPGAVVAYADQKHFEELNAIVAAARAGGASTESIVAAFETALRNSVTVDATATVTFKGAETNG